MARSWQRAIGAEAPGNQKAYVLRLCLRRVAQGSLDISGGDAQLVEEPVDGIAVLELVGEEAIPLRGAHEGFEAAARVDVHQCVR